jgi:Protein of unknown function (DUF2510)
MQEFSSVTASSYDADALAPLLSEKAAAGWDVISIVSAGTNIVAYLSREKSGIGDAMTVESVDEAIVVDDTTAAPTLADTATADPTPSGTGMITAADAVDEPAGWGSEPEAATEPMPSVEELASQITEPAPAAAEPAPYIAAAAEPAAVQPAAAEPVSEPAAVESTVPAGWYADPSGRYELRYWDGTAWTEHVSRAGQQFTDPPVA